MPGTTPIPTAIGQSRRTHVPADVVAGSVSTVLAAITDVPAASITVDAVLATELRHTVPILPGEAFTTVGPVMFSALADGPFGMKHSVCPGPQAAPVARYPGMVCPGVCASAGPHASSRTAWHEGTKDPVDPSTTVPGLRDG